MTPPDGSTLPTTGIGSLDQSISELSISAAALVRIGPAEPALRRLAKVFEAYREGIEATLRRHPDQKLMKSRRAHEVLTLAIEQLIDDAASGKDVAADLRRAMESLHGVLTADAASIRAAMH